VAVGSATRADVARLMKVLAGHSRVLILTHGNPDPDALASAAALKLLVSQKAGIPCAIGYSGSLTRPENRQMVKRLGLRVRNVTHIDLRRFRAVVLVDTQPGAGNNYLSDKQHPIAAIDHHRLTRATAGCQFHKVDPECGATSTIVYEMLSAAGIAPPAKIATGLFYGIKTDTLDLGREATERDRDAYVKLFPLTVHRTLALIVHPRLPEAYYRIVHNAVEHAVIYGNCIYAGAGAVPTPEYVSTIADYVAELEGMRWAVATGIHAGDLYFSVRTLTARKDAGKILRHAIGQHGFAGGHQKMAGGVLLLSDVAEGERAAVEAKVRQSLIAALGANTAAPRNLLSGAEETPSR